MSRKMVVTISQFTPAHREAIRAAAQKHGFEALFFDHGRDAFGAVGDAEILFTASAKLAHAAKQLKWMNVPSAGVNPYVVPGVFSSPETILTSSSGAYGVTIAEHIVMVVLEILRRESEYRGIVARHDWTRDLEIRSINRSRITILGTGNIGQETAKRLRAFEPASLTGVNRGRERTVGAFDRIIRNDTLDDVLPETDILVITVPGTKETLSMIDARRLDLLPKGALVINVGRGSVIEQAALEERLRAGRLFAALDVFEEEPVPQSASLWDCPNLLITPHNAGNMSLPGTIDRIVELFLENFDNYCEGRPLKRVIDFDAGY